MARKSSDNVRVGRTIAQEWEKQESESERLLNRKKAKNKKIFRVLFFLAALAVIAVAAYTVASNVMKERERIEAETPAIVPTIELIDEAGAGVTRRMKEYVGQYEEDIKAEGYTASRAVVPAGKSREVHVFISGYDFYVKLNIDRGTAVSAEDTARMIKYLDEHDIHPEYIDVRVKGKGYYK